MATISACIICKNEEEKIVNLLSSIKDVVDEIIIVDTGSTDKTVLKALGYTNNVFHFEWINDFAKARNYSFEKATGDWIIWLDSDDIFLKKDIEKFNELKKELDSTNIDVYSLWYSYRHDKNGNCTYKFQRERLIRNGMGFHWDYPIHEALLTHGNKQNTDISVTHTNNHDNGHKYIDFFKKKIYDGYELRQRDMYYYGGELAIFGYQDEAQEIFERFFNMGEHNNQYEAKRAAEYLLDIYIDKKMYNSALETIFKYLKYGYPDPKIFYKMGMVYERLNKKEEAIFYYKVSTDMKNDFPDEGCVVNEYSNFIFSSSLQLVVILYSLNRIEESKKYHLISKELNPESETVKYNDQFFI